MREPVQEYVLRCGSLYLGTKHAARVSSFERAVRFDSREIAEARAEELRGTGVFQLLWEVVALENPYGPTTEQLFSWNLSQERIDGLAQLLYKLETVSDILGSENITAKRAAVFLSDLRVQCSAAGAQDPFPDMPLSPRFDEIRESVDQETGQC